MGDTPHGDDLGGGQTADGSADAWESGANPQVLKDYSDAGLERLAGLRDRLSGLRGSLEQVRMSIAYLSADVDDPDIPSPSDLGRDGEGVAVEDQLDELIDNWEHLDGFAGRVADGFLEAERIDAGSDAADRTYTVPSARIAATGIGFADRNAAITEGERLAGQATDLEDMSYDERGAWLDAVERGGLDPAFAVAFTNKLGTDGLETLPDVFDLGGTDRAINPTAKGALSAVVDTALATAASDSEVPYEQRIRASLLSDLWDNPDLIRPFAYSNQPDRTPALNQTLGFADARRVNQILNDADLESGRLDPDGDGLDYDEDQLADLAELYPDLADVLTARPPLTQNPTYAAAFVNRLGADNTQTLIDLTNTFGLAHDNDLIRSVPGTDGQIHHEAGEPEIAITGDHSTDGPHDFYVEPLSRLLGSADRSGDLEPDIVETIISVDTAGTYDSNDAIMTSIQQQRATALVLDAGHFSDGTTAAMAQSIIDSNEPWRDVEAPRTPDEFAHLEGFTSEEFLTSTDGRQSLADNVWTAYDELSDHPVAASIFYSEPGNLERALSWTISAAPPDDGVVLVSDRLGLSSNDARDLMQQTGADSVEAGLTSDNDTHRAAAMNTAIDTVADLDEIGEPFNDTIANPHMRQALATGTAANMDIISTRINAPLEHLPSAPEAITDQEIDDYVNTFYFLSDVMKDPEAALTIHQAVYYDGLETVTALTGGEDPSSDLARLGQVQGFVTEAETRAGVTEALDELIAELEGDYPISPTPGQGVDFGIGRVPGLGDVNDLAMVMGISTGEAIDWLTGQLGHDADEYEQLGEAERQASAQRAEDALNRALWLAVGLYDSNMVIDAPGYGADTPIHEILHDTAAGQPFLDENGEIRTDLDPRSDEAQALRTWAVDMVGSTGEPGPLFDLEDNLAGGALAVQVTPEGAPSEIDVRGLE